MKLIPHGVVSGPGRRFGERPVGHCLGPVAVAAGWTPASEAGLRGHWDVPTEFAATGLGASISEWAGVSRASGIEKWVQATPSAQPVLGSLGGHKMILTDGIDDVLQTDGTDELLRADSVGVAGLIVTAFNPVPAFGEFLLSASTTGGSDDFIYVLAATKQLACAVGGTGTPAVVNSPSLADSVIYCIVFHVVDGAQAIRVYEVSNEQERLGRGSHSVAKSNFTSIFKVGGTAKTLGGVPALPFYNGSFLGELAFWDTNTEPDWEGDVLPYIYGRWQ